MIRSLLQRVRDWSPFVKFTIAFTVIMFVIDLLQSGDFHHAVNALFIGATMIASGEFIGPVLVGALFSWIHERQHVPAPCGDPAVPSSVDWHRLFVSLVGTYLLIAVSTGLLRAELSFAPLIDTAVFMAPWLGLFLFMNTIFEAFHFLGHRRAHREELAERERARREEDTARRFWGMVREHRPDPGGVA